MVRNYLSASRSELDEYWGRLKIALERSELHPDLCVGGMAALEALLSMEGSGAEVYFAKFKNATNMALGLYEEVE